LFACFRWCVIVQYLQCNRQLSVEYFVGQPIFAHLCPSLPATTVIPCSCVWDGDRVMEVLSCSRVSWFNRRRAGISCSAHGTCLRSITSQRLFFRRLHESKDGHVFVTTGPSTTFDQHRPRPCLFLVTCMPWYYWATHNHAWQYVNTPWLVIDNKLLCWATASTTASITDAIVGVEKEQRQSHCFILFTYSCCNYLLIQFSLLLSEKRVFINNIELQRS